PRGCGILWAAPDRQSMLRSPIISWGYGKGFLEEFEHTATSDPTSCLAAPEGIALLQEWNFEACVAYMHGLAWDAAHQLADRWGTSFDIPRAMTGSMCTVAMPEGAGSSDDDAERIRLALLVEDKIEVPVHASHDRLWARVSAQVYNDASDITRLAEAGPRRGPGRGSAGRHPKGGPLR